MDEEGLDQLKHISNLHYRLYNAYSGLCDCYHELEEKKEDIRYLREDIGELIEELKNTLKRVDINV